jgi:hypothetical protein
MDVISKSLLTTKISLLSDTPQVKFIFKSRESFDTYK